MGNLCKLAGLTAVLAVTAASGMPAMSVSTAASGQWVLEQENYTCSMEASLTPNQSMQVAIAEGQDSATLSFRGNLPNVGPRHRPLELDVVLFPAAQRFKSTAMLTADPDTNEGILVVSALPEAILDQLERATSLAIEAPGKRLLHVPVPSTHSASRDLRSCGDNLLRTWGLDPVFLRSLKRKPKATKGAYVRASDYPAISIQRREQGRSIVRFTVDVDGRAKNCVPVVSSGFSALDAATCKAVTRGRFEPGVDQNGRVTPVQMVVKMTWSLGR